MLSFGRMNLMIIRPATIEDLKNCEILIKLPEMELPYGGHIDKKFMENYLDPDFFLVMEEKSEIIGLIIGEPLRGKGIMIWYMTIKKDFQGKGFGKKLLTEFEKICREKNRNWIVLYGPTYNKKTVEFYEKMEYKKGKSYFEFVKEFMVK